jgi:hypothetical protein
LCLIATSLQAAQKPQDPVLWFVTEDGKPTEHFRKLLELSDIYSPSDRLPEIVQKTQNAWIKVIQGKNGKERLDMQDSPDEVKIRDSVESIAREIGLFDARKPSLSHYDYAVCHGAFLDGVQGRVQELVEAWNEGIRFDSLVFLTGERTLRKEQQDSLSKLMGEEPLPSGTPYETEYDMCKLVWEKAKVPEEMRKALIGKVVFVNAKRPDGQERPNTKDTITTWLTEYHPQPGTVIAFSYPMVWTYQQVAGATILGKEYPLDTCAKAVTEEMLLVQKPRIVSLVHDTVAKVLYEAVKTQSFTESQGSKPASGGSHHH